MVNYFNDKSKGIKNQLSISLSLSFFSAELFYDYNFTFLPFMSSFCETFILCPKEKLCACLLYKSQSFFVNHQIRFHKHPSSKINKIYNFFYYFININFRTNNSSRYNLPHKYTSNIRFLRYNLLLQRVLSRKIGLVGRILEHLNLIFA